MRLTALLTISGLAAAASGDVVWDELLDGDLSSDPNAPTSLVFALGGNTISGSMGAPDDVRDYITFEIPDGMGLVSLLQHEYVDLSSGGPGNTGFHAIIEGATSFIPDADNIHLFLGGDHLDPFPPGTDLLQGLANANLGGTGFDVPLGPGVYTYHVQQTGTDLTGYTLEFVTIPAPGAAVLLVAGVSALRRRR